MSTKKNKTNTQSTQTVTGPAWLEPKLQEAGNFSTKYFDYYTANPFGSALVPFSSETEQSLAQKTALATAGSPVVAANTQNVTDTLSGKYLSPDSNPWLAEIIKRSGDQVSNDVNSRYEMGGRGGSGAWSGALTDALIGNSAKLYGANYDAERGRMMQASSLAPQADAMRYNDSMVLGDVGAQREAQAQAAVEDRYRQWLAPMQNLQDYITNLRGNPATAYTTTTGKGKATQYSTGMDYMGMVAGLLSPKLPSMGGGG
jgi:hypothetical protein